MNRIIRRISFTLIISFLFSSCSILDQSKEMKTFTKCMFRLVDVQDVVLAGVDVQDVQSFSDLSFTEASALSMSALTGKLPLGLTVNIEIKNPNPEQASMTDMYWILLVDDIEITEGKVGQKVVVPPGGSTIMPVDVQVDLFKIMTGESADAVMNFGLNLAGSGNAPSRVKLKIKPYINIAMTRIKYPGFFTIEEEFVSE